MPPQKSTLRFFYLQYTDKTVSVCPFSPDIHLADEDKEDILSFFLPLQQSPVEYFILDLLEVEHFHSESVLHLLFEIMRLYLKLSNSSSCQYKTIPPQKKIPREIFDLLGLDHMLEYSTFQG